MASTPKPMRRRRDESPAWLRGYVFLGSSLLIAGLFLYTHNLTVRLDRQVRAMSRVLADFCASVTFEAIESERIQTVFREVVHQIDFPVILTDAQGRPYAWKGIGISVDAVPLGESLEFDPENPPAEGTLSRILETSQEMDRRNPPVAMVRAGSEQVVGYVHYGESRLLRELRWVPFVEIVAFFLFITLGFLGFRSAKISEQRYIWVGMAKETAHQLGTPISSLMGWLEILNIWYDEEKKAGMDEDELTQIEDVSQQMTRDIERLQKIANRFSQIGSRPALKTADLNKIIEDVVGYFRERLPYQGKGITISFMPARVDSVRINSELIGWVIENLIKNSLEACDPMTGRIMISTSMSQDNKSIIAEFADNGKGIPPGGHKKIFNPGFTSKKRGWGLGLSLAKRIIEEYHDGHIAVKSSIPNKETAIQFSLPAEKNGSEEDQTG